MPPTTQPPRHARSATNADHNIPTLARAQDGYIKWDDVDVATMGLPAGDDMGIPRCAPRHPPASTLRSPRARAKIFRPVSFPARDPSLRARAARRTLAVPITR